LFPNTGTLFSSDLFFAFVPLTFVYRLHRPLRERILISIMMAIGLLAIITSTVKLYLLYQFWFRIDPTSYNYNFVNFLIPTWVEVFITIIGATVPCLNSLLMTWMRKCGFMAEQSSNVWGHNGRINLTDTDVTDVTESTEGSSSGDGREIQEVKI
jgi:hypothetical protein